MPLIRPELAAVAASGTFDATLRKSWEELCRVFGQYTPFQFEPEALAAHHAVAWVTDSDHEDRPSPGPLGLFCPGEDWRAVVERLFGSEHKQVDERFSATPTRREAAIVQSSGRWPDHRTLRRDLVPGDALAVRWWYRHAAAAAKWYQVFNADHFPWSSLGWAFGLQLMMHALQEAVPFYLPSGQLGVIADSEPIGSDDLDDIRLPYKCVLVVPAEPIVMPPTGTASPGANTAIEVFDDPTHPWFKDGTGDDADSTELQAVAASELDRLGYLFNDFRSGAHLTLDDAVATRGALVEGVVLIGTDDGLRLADEFIWCLAIPDATGESVIGRIAVPARRSRCAWAAQIDNLAAMAAWADWHPPERRLELPDDVDSREFRRALKRGHFRRLEPRGAGGDVHVLDVARTNARARDAETADGPTRSIAAHRRRGHWRKVRTGTRHDWEQHRSNRRVRIAPTIVNAGLGGDSLQVYRLPDTSR